MPLAYGTAKDVGFGTIALTGFVVIENQDEEVSFNKEVLIENELGDVTGMFKSDKRGTVNITALAKLSEIETLGLGGILASTATFPELVDGDAYIETIRSTRVKGDVRRWEISAQAFDGLSGDGVEITDPEPVAP